MDAMDAMDNRVLLSSLKDSWNCARLLETWVMRYRTGILRNSWRFLLHWNPWIFSSRLKYSFEILLELLTSSFEGFIRLEALLNEYIISIFAIFFNFFSTVYFQHRRLPIFLFVVADVGVGGLRDSLRFSYFRDLSQHVSLLMLLPIKQWNGLFPFPLSVSGFSFFCCCFFFFFSLLLSLLWSSLPCLLACKKETRWMKGGWNEIEEIESKEKYKERRKLYALNIDETRMSGYWFTPTRKNP